MWLLLTVMFGCLPGPETAADCIPTTGDNCDCQPKCMTQGQLDRIRSFCDLGCFFSQTGDTGVSTEPNWTCTIVDGECAVAQ